MGSQTRERADIWKDQRTRNQRDISKVIDHANKQQLDLLLIAGDLFDQPPTQQELREVDYLLSRLNHTRTVLIAGNHDHLEPHDAFSQYKWNSEVYLLDGKQRDYISFEDLETTIYGFS